MNYEAFIDKCADAVASARQQEGTFKYKELIGYEKPSSLEPSNVHLEVYIHSKATRIKLEEWSFVTQKTLLKSINCEDDDSDPELDNVEVHL